MADRQAIPSVWPRKPCIALAEQPTNTATCSRDQSGDRRVIPAQRLDPGCATVIHFEKCPALLSFYTGTPSFTVGGPGHKSLACHKGVYDVLLGRASATLA